MKDQKKTKIDHNMREKKRGDKKKKKNGRSEARDGHAFGMRNKTKREKNEKKNERDENEANGARKPMTGKYIDR